MLVIIYHVLAKLEPYKEQGANYFDQREEESIQRRLVRRLERLGYEVTVKKAA